MGHPSIWPQGAQCVESAGWWPSDLQNCEILNLHCFQPLNMQEFVLAAALPGACGGVQVSRQGAQAPGESASPAAGPLLPSLSQGSQSGGRHLWFPPLASRPHQGVGGGGGRRGEGECLATPDFSSLWPFPPRKENTDFLTIVRVISPGACQLTCTGQFHPPGPFAGLPGVRLRGCHRAALWPSGSHPRGWFSFLPLLRGSPRPLPQPLLFAAILWSSREFHPPEQEARKVPEGH